MGLATPLDLLRSHRCGRYLAKLTKKDSCVEPCIYVCVYIYIYIYVERERENYIYIYIYMRIYREAYQQT